MAGVRIRNLDGDAKSRRCVRVARNGQAKEEESRLDPRRFLRAQRLRKFRITFSAGDGALPRDRPTIPDRRVRRRERQGRVWPLRWPPLVLEPPQ